MLNKTLQYVILGLVAASLFSMGCLVSGTYPIKEDINFSFTADAGYYWYPVDLAGNPDWEDHKDDIDDIDAVGFIFDITNNSSEDCEFTVMLKAETGPADINNPPAVLDPDDFTTVIDGLSVAAGATRHVSYSESLGFIRNDNLPTIKTILKTGRFDYLGYSCGGTGDALFEITEGSIIVTVSASS